MTGPPRVGLCPDDDPAPADVRRVEWRKRVMRARKAARDRGRAPEPNRPGGRRARGTEALLGEGPCRIDEEMQI